MATGPKANKVTKKSEGYECFGCDADFGTNIWTSFNQKSKSIIVVIAIITVITIITTVTVIATTVIGQQRIGHGAMIPSSAIIFVVIFRAISSLIPISSLNIDPDQSF